ncbi:hypothetical protein [Actinomadura parmotrematis]|uniref:FCD domain-containing protein n=1 Tax=Actinomadura parmotrematis TaxID=2864039 RepID=A0ABS7G1L2_9ACTN|nr:hypothetical protein [Actinomadura parmotrematis]MBW8486591.1 hypothetical protein [Actinomadura parmotrematis]
MPGAGLAGGHLVDHIVNKIVRRSPSRRGRRGGAWERLAYSELNAALHALVEEIAGRRTVRAVLARLRARLVRHQFRTGADAIVARDPAAARAAVRAHLDDVIARLAEAGAGAEPPDQFGDQIVDNRWGRS